MPTLQISDISQDLYNKLQESAENNRRSLNQQAIAYLEIAMNVESKTQKKIEALARIKSYKPFFQGISKEDVVAEIRKDRDH